MIILRHGQSESNLHLSLTCRDDFGQRDPPLTAAGETHARSAATSVSPETICRIITSPYTRALQTASIVQNILNVPVSVEPLIRGRFNLTSDIGTPASELAKMWPQYDFSSLHEIWWPSEKETTRQMLARAHQFSKKMNAGQQWKDTLLISHWGFILVLTAESTPNGDLIVFNPGAGLMSSIPIGFIKAAIGKRLNIGLSAIFKPFRSALRSAAKLQGE